MTEPQQVMASAVYEVLPNWRLLGNVGLRIGRPSASSQLEPRRPIRRRLGRICIFQIPVRLRSGSNPTSPKNGSGQRDLPMTVRRVPRRTVMRSCRLIVSYATGPATNTRSVGMSPPAPRGNSWTPVTHHLVIVADRLRELCRDIFRRTIF